jgi:transcriptional regulator with XRE-family HTH domain
MTGMRNGNPAFLFGKRLTKERKLRGWTTAELARRMKVNAAHLSRVELGRRPPTEKLALAADDVFGRDDFLELYEEMRTWAPPGFRDFSELEENASALRDWYPGIVTGLLQTESYASALLRTSPGATAEVIASRLASRMERQRRVLFRDDPPRAWFILDEVALYRRVGSPLVMAEQCAHLADVASLPNVTIQVMPAVEHPANASGFVIADDSAWCENVKGGYVYTGETVTPLPALFDTLRGESLKVSESTALFGRMIDTWHRLGARARTATQTGDSASK